MERAHQSILHLSIKQFAPPITSYLDLLEIVGRRIDGRSRFAHVVDVGVLLAHLVLVLGASLQELFGKLGAFLRFACVMSGWNRLNELLCFYQCSELCCPLPR